MQCTDGMPQQERLAHIANTATLEVTHFARTVLHITYVHTP